MRETIKTLIIHRVSQLNRSLPQFIHKPAGIGTQRQIRSGIKSAEDNSILYLASARRSAETTMKVMIKIARHVRQTIPPAHDLLRNKRVS